MARVETKTVKKSRKLKVVTKENQKKEIKKTARQGM